MNIITILQLQKYIQVKINRDGILHNCTNMYNGNLIYQYTVSACVCCVFEFFIDFSNLNPQLIVVLYIMNFVVLFPIKNWFCFYNIRF